MQKVATGGAAGAARAAAVPAEHAGACHNFWLAGQVSGGFVTRGKQMAKTCQENVVVGKEKNTAADRATNAAATPPTTPLPSAAHQAGATFLHFV